MTPAELSEILELAGLRLPGLDTSELFARALTAGVAFVPGRAFAVPGSTAQHGDAMRLSFSTLTDDELRMAADRLFSVAARMP